MLSIPNKEISITHPFKLQIQLRNKMQKIKEAIFLRGRRKNKSTQEEEWKHNHDAFLPQNWLEDGKERLKHSEDDGENEGRSGEKEDHWLKNENWIRNKLLKL